MVERVWTNQTSSISSLRKIGKRSRNLSSCSNPQIYNKKTLWPTGKHLPSGWIFSLGAFPLPLSNLRRPHNTYVQPAVPPAIGPQARPHSTGIYPSMGGLVYRKNPFLSRGSVFPHVLICVHDADWLWDMTHSLSIPPSVPRSLQVSSGRSSSLPPPHPINCPQTPILNPTEIQMPWIHSTSSLTRASSSGATLIAGV